MSGETATFSSVGETTGRFLVLFRREAVDAGITHLADRAGVQVVRAAEEGISALEEAPDAGGVVFEKLGVAVVDVPPDQRHALAGTDEGGPVAAVEPERVVYAVPNPPNPPGAGAEGLSSDYLRGYRDAVAALSAAAGVGAHAPAAGAAAVAATPLVDGEVTWGLQAVNVPASTATGRGVRVAVLDTGFDVEHPDFADRQPVTQSFVPGEEVRDGHGHGTHCIGTACGPLAPGEPPRYGVAPEAEIFAGKVLNNRGRGTDENILAGIEWALSNNCKIVSMSLGGRMEPGAAFSQVFENVAQRAMDQGMVLIGVAGNDSNRDSGLVSPVSHPASCPSIMAVAALNSSFEVASFSNQGTDVGGGQVDFAAPGVDVRSSWPMPLQYRTSNGTSMATPHVAGIAALVAERNPTASAADLLSLVRQAVRPLELPSKDVGAGLVRAP